MHVMLILTLIIFMSCQAAPVEIRRRLLIGTLPLITTLNDEAITKEERKEAESFCVQYYKGRDYKPYA